MKSGSYNRIPNGAATATTNTVGTSQPTLIEPITVRIPTAIQITGIGRSKLYELIKAGEIETVKIGSATLLKMESLRRLTKTELP